MSRPAEYGDTAFIPCLLAYSSRLCLIFAVHAGSAWESSTVTTTTGAPLPMATLGRFGALELLLPPPIFLNNQNTVRKPSMPNTTNRNLSLRNKFFSAGGIRKPFCCLAAYGGGRDVFLGGRAKCIVCGGRAWPGRGHL
jgi:hypothetical protein